MANEWEQFKAGKRHLQDLPHIERAFREKIQKLYGSVTTTDGESFTDLLTSWQSTTRGREGKSLRYMTSKLEKVPPGKTAGDTFKNIEELQNFFKKGGSLLGDEAYIKIRAYNQVYARKIRNMEVTTPLLRGTEGETGRKIADGIAEGVSRKRTTHAIDDNILVGYTDDAHTAAHFGHESGGATVQKFINLDDIVIHKDLLYGATNKYPIEKEYIIRGFKWKVTKGNYVIDGRDYRSKIGIDAANEFEALWEELRFKYF